MAAEVAKSSSSADSYLGSLISLTSKSEIRYEGVLYSINPDESSIGLQNVRSFGSEGRKKDGPQIPPSDRVYEYILFRGTDIKDLQVKSSPPVQTTLSIDNDPAIIQSHYPRPPAPSTSLSPAVSVSPTDVNSHAPQLGHPGSNFPGGIPLYQPAPSSSLPAAVSVSPTDVNSHAPQPGHPGSNFPGGIPLYQPGASLGSWGPSPPPSVNGNPLPMPMYWPGMYGPPNGLPHLHQQTLLQPPPGLSVPPSLQMPMQFSGYSAPPQASAPNVPNPNINLLTTSSSSNIFGYNPSPPVGTLNVSTSSSPLAATSSTSLLPLSLPVVPSVTSASEPPSSSVFNKGSSSVLPSMALNVNLSTSLPLAISNSETSSINAPVSSKVNTVPSSLLPYPNFSQPTTSIVSSSTPNLSEAPTPSLVTPGQLLPSGQSETSSESSQTVHKDVEVVQASSSSEQTESVLKEKEAQPPILPLPSAPRTYNKPHPHGGPHVRHNYRGSVRGRGTGGCRPLTRFAEDFDFTAMNEKFNKDEVWGELGKKNKAGDENDDGDYEDEDSAELANIEAKAVYNKDDFFDSLSSNALNNTSQNGRPRFSEQLKLDAETFGESGRYNRGGRGGRGFARGGRNSNYGRGYGYSASGRGGYGYGGRGRGRGRAIYSQAS